MIPRKEKFEIPYTRLNRVFDVFLYIFKLVFFYGLMYISQMRLKGYIGCLVFSIGLVSTLYVIYDWLRLNFTEKYKQEEITKLRNTFLVETRSGYIYFKKEDIIDAAINIINDTECLLKLKLKQCFFYKSGLFNNGYVVVNTNEIDITQCNPDEYLDLLCPLPFDRFELSAEYDRNAEESKDIAYFSASDASAVLSFADKDKCANICQALFELPSEKIFMNAQPVNENNEP